MANNTGRKRTCSKCGEDLKDRFPKYRYCIECHAAYMRKTRPKYGELTDEQKRKADIRTLTNHALRDGLITKQPCQVCGSTKSEMHHEDYDNPMKVIWLCRKHHIEIHKNGNNKNNS